jgi:subfamily B ATP-binding cassette protein MsbA
MDPILIDADDRQRASKASVRSPEFKRLLRLIWPHRRLIIIGFICSVIFAFLHAVGVLGVLPILKVMLSDEGLHGWVYRSAAQGRLNLSLHVTGDKDGEKDVVIVDIRSKSKLRDYGVTEYDTITGYEFVAPADLAGPAEPAEAPSPVEVQDTPTASAHPINAFEFLKAVAEAGPEAVVMLTIRHKGTTDHELPPIEVKLDHISAQWWISCALSRYIPRAVERHDRVTTLDYVLAIVVFIAVLSNVARFISQYYMAAGVLRAVMDLRRTLYRKVLRLPMDFFTQKTSDVVTRFVQDAQEVQRGMVAFFGKMLREPVKVVFLLIVALNLNARLTLSMLLIGPVAIFIFWAVGRKIRKANRRLLESYGVMIGALSASLHAIGVVKAYNAENIERKRLWQIDRRMFKHQLRIAMLEAYMPPFLEVLAVFGIAAVTVWLGSQVLNEEIKLEEFGTLVLALGMLIDPLRKVADVYPRVVRSAAGATRIFSVIDSPEEAELLEGAIELPPLADRIEFRDVHFTYPNAGLPALDGVNVSIKKGEAVAIVGPNGSGKTTLTKLLLRFHDPQSGAVLFDGTDIRKGKLRALRRQISIVSQDPVVFEMTIAENIAYGTRDYEIERVVEAARSAHADAFIRTKPGGYDEVVGERGTTLSGGQRQRICIARAIMRNAPILIFDEATSQIDSESEQQIQDAIREFAAGRTTILIAHRLSTIRFAERVIVMDEGHVLDSGTHEELLERCPLYTTLCRTQLLE